MDRGIYGPEVIMLIFCLKILAPDKFFILRGNHEIRVIQEQFTFKELCQVRFNGTAHWEAFNDAMDCMPLAAVIDENIYGSHGTSNPSILLGP